MDSLTLFGLFAVCAMLASYAFERRSPWFVLAFALSCWLGSAYGFLQGAWPFGIVEAVWGLVALRRWWGARRDQAGAAKAAASRPESLAPANSAPPSSASRRSASTRLP